MRPAENSFPCQHLQLALEAAVRAGNDTDTVAAIAGALLGARWGCSGIPLQWQQAVNGWPGLTGVDLVRLAVLTAQGGKDDGAGWPSVARMPAPADVLRGFAIPHPHDPGVVLGNLALLQGTEPVDVDAVVSLCRMGTEPVLPVTDAEHVRVWLVDSDGHNDNLHYVVDQAARAVLRLRQAGKRVLLHCAAGQSRTPAVAAVYSNLATGTGPETALSDLRKVLSHGWHLSAHAELQDAVHALAGPAVNSQASLVSTSEEEEGEQGVLLGVDPEPEERTEFLREKWAASRVRGLLLGLAVGDTLGAAGGKLPAEVSLRAGVSTQLACFTAEGTIRAFVRGDHRGLSSLSGVVWHAYRRWAALQGIEVPDRPESGNGGAWPDGWLAQVPVLAQRRGSAPATVAALTASGSGSAGKPTASRGCHALTRTLPVAVAVAGHNSHYWVQEARAMAALTHGDPAAQSATAHAVVLAARCLTNGPQPQVRQVLKEGIRSLRDITAGDELGRLTRALERADAHPADANYLAHLAPDATAPSALLGGVYVAASFPERNRVDAALRFAAGAPDADSVACVTGALLGAAHGVEALPVDLVSRHELAWVLDTLAHDLIAQITERPSGTEYTAGWDEHWWDRYPGW